MVFSLFICFLTLLFIYFLILFYSDLRFQCDFSGVSETMDDKSKEIKKIKDEKNKLKVSQFYTLTTGWSCYPGSLVDPLSMQTLEDNYERTLQDEAKELEQLLSKRSVLLAKEEEHTKKITDLGLLPSDAFET